MRAIEEDIACAIRNEAGVMISGERGTGKKHIARRIHEHSDRSMHPFVIASGADMTTSLLRSNKGSLLIENLETLPAAAQVQLLGFTRSRATRRGRSVRLLTTASADVFASIHSNEVMEELFYHLNVIHLVIPALRDRPEDIPVLFGHYISYYAHGEVRQLSPVALERLVAYAWPGNVQELKAAAEHVARQGQGAGRLVDEDNLPVTIRH
jgi:DNA-binding NtrC family response regulator